MMDCALKFENVSKTFNAGKSNEIRAIANVSIAIPVGATIGIVGPNRAGKSTFLKLALGLLKPDQGSVYRLDSQAANRSTLKQTGAVLELPFFPSHLSPRHILSILGSLSGISQEQLPNLISTALNKVGLEDRAKQSVGEFSRGMTQRLLIAQAILASPSLLVLDEPFEGLDFDALHKVRNLLADYRNQGKTIVIVSHDLTEIENLCSHIALFNNGKVLRYDSTDLWRGVSNQPFLEQAIMRACLQLNPSGFTL